MAENPYESPQYPGEEPRSDPEEFSPEPYGSYWEFFRDVGLAFLLTMGGFYLAGTLAAPFRDVSDLAYSVGLSIGLAPLWWFTRRQRIHNRGWGEYLGICVVVIAIAGLSRPLARANVPGLGIVVLAAAIGCLSWIGRRRRR